jgi:hypothetical protein
MERDEHALPNGHPLRNRSSWAIGTDGVLGNVQGLNERRTGVDDPVVPDRPERRVERVERVGEALAKNVVPAASIHRRGDGPDPEGPERYRHGHPPSGPRGGEPAAHDDSQQAVNAERHDARRLQVATRAGCDAQDDDASEAPVDPYPHRGAGTEPDQGGEREAQEPPTPHGPRIEPVLAHPPEGTDGEEDRLAHVAGRHPKPEWKRQAQGSPDRQEHRGSRSQN